MAELWQTYGSWVIYGLFFLAMLWAHGRMHGHDGHRQHAEHSQHPDHAEHSAGQSDANEGDPNRRQGHNHGGCC